VTAPANLAWEAQCRAFPHADIDGCHTALLLFGAGFHGWNDGWHVAHAGIHGTVVDINAERLHEMRDLYPADWKFIQNDAFVAAQRAADMGGSFDLVSVDCFTNLSDTCFREIPLWTSIARRTVLITVTSDTLAGPARGARAPEGWRPLPPLERATGVYWYRLQKETTC